MRLVLVVLAACSSSPGALPDAQRDGSPAALPDGPMAGAQLAATADITDFGLVDTGATVVSHFEIANTGAAASGPVALSVQGTDVTLAPLTCPPLDGGAHCMAELAWTPEAAGAVAITVTATADPGGVATLAISGTSLPSEGITISPTGLHDFGAVHIGSISSAQTFTVTNDGGPTTGPLSVTPGGDTANFTVIADSCAGLALPASLSCTVEIAFVPTVLGPLHESFGIVGTPGGIVSAQVTGTGLPVSAALAISPMAHDFGSVIIGCSAAPTTFTVTNPGGSASAPLATALGGLDANAFAIVQDDCAGTSLAPGASCAIEVGIGNQSPVQMSAGLVVTAGPLQASAGLFVRGSTIPSLRVTPFELSFGAVAVGAASTMSVTVSNTAGCPTSGALSLALGGVDPSFFSTANDACTGKMLAGGESCTIGVVFSPTAPGPRQGTLSVLTSSAGYLAVGMLGATPGATIAVNPSSLDLGQTPAGMTSAQRTITVWNGGPPTDVLSVAASGDASMFSIIDMCSGGSLATGASCMLFVTFAPTASGTFDAQYAVSAGSGGTVQTAVHGVAGPPADFAIEPKFGFSFESCSSTPVSAQDARVPLDGFTPDGLVASTCRLAFGAVAPGSTATQTFTVTNEAAMMTAPIYVFQSGAEEMMFPTSGCTGQALALLESCTMTVTYAPITPGPHSTSVGVGASPGGLASVYVETN